MGDTSIEWTDKTWNPVTGCTKVSPGCDNCYAEAITNRFKRGPFEEIVLHPERLRQPWHWRKPRMIFTCSMSDLFHPKVPFDFVHCVRSTMAGPCAHHTFQVLTKRPGRMAYFANEYIDPIQINKEVQGWPSNVWAGTSVESAKYLPRLDVLARVPAGVRFVSCEPLLGPLDLRPWLSARVPCEGYCSCDQYFDVAHGERCMSPLSGSLQWVIVGGESGPRARPIHPQWVRDIRDQCEEAGVPFFFKQWGEWEPQGQHLKPAERSDFRHVHKWPDAVGVCRVSYRIGKKAAGAVLDGREHREIPIG